MNPDEHILELSAEEVKAFLKSQPDFLRQHPDILQHLTPPEQKLGNKVLDFQSFAMQTLQHDMQDLKDKFNGLLSSARDNMSSQSQVHDAVLQLMQAMTLEQVLEVLTQDFMRLFDVDAVRLVLESELAEFYESTYSEINYSGISFVPLQTVDMALGINQTVALAEDTHKDPPYAYEAIFIDCSGLIRSCALLRIHLPKIQRDGILAFGVREKGRFHANQGTDLLRFLSDATAVRLDQCLHEHELEMLR
ncbi:MAG: hypothetical protein CMM93_02165 [Rickettsiales bacterium]|nr:hypothetical protein [Rickettsiales bacterium]